jgi:hypothetical protein
MRLLLLLFFCMAVDMRASCIQSPSSARPLHGDPRVYPLFRAAFFCRYSNKRSIEGWWRCSSVSSGICRWIYKRVENKMENKTEPPSSSFPAQRVHDVNTVASRDDFARCVYTYMDGVSRSADDWQRCPKTAVLKKFKIAVNKWTYMRRAVCTSALWSLIYTACNEPSSVNLKLTGFINVYIRAD